MATASGKDGEVYEGANKVADITGWTLDREVATGAYTSSDTAGIVKRVQGFTDWSGTFDYVGDGEDSANMPDIGDEITLNLRSTGATVGWTGTAIVKSNNVTVTVDENPIAGSVVFEGNGAIAELA